MQHFDSDEDREAARLLDTLVGRTVVGVVWHPATCDYPQGEEYADVEFDDGRTVRFGAWGYDAWGATVDEVPR